MRINANHRSWVTGTIGITALATVAYIFYVRATPYGPSGGSWPGLIFGIIGTACMLIDWLLVLRKKLRTRRGLGSAQLWMKMHIWLGVLAVPFILFHSGFGWGGPLTTTIMVLFYLVIASGIVGLLLQQILPATMTERVAVETIHSQIGYVLEGLAADAYEVVASIVGVIPEAAEEQARLAADEAVLKTRGQYWKQIPRQHPAEEPAPGAAVLKDFYLKELRPYLRREKGAAAAMPDFRRVLIQAPDDWRGKLDKLQNVCEESRQLAVQTQLHGWLHNWLLVHAPLSFALFVLVVFHIFFALRY